MILTSKLITYVALISLVSTTTTTTSAAAGFTTDLIHRDSPHSPSYDPSLSPSQRVADALKRSFHRARRFKSRHTAPQSDLIYSTGAYLMRFSVGTPPLPSVAIADTGSDIIWTQCRPCLQCIKQSLPIFHPQNSSTYRKLPCDSPRCDSSAHTYCNLTADHCLYSESYQDGSFTDGELATDTFTLASSGGTPNTMISVPTITFGCGFNNGGVFSGRESGIVGLGGGDASLVRQLGRLAKGRFSYCLVPVSDHSNLSKLHFGKARRSRRAVSTPLTERGPKTFYHLTLEGISVGGRRLGLDGGEGNIVIDSGTTFTLLPPVLYEGFENAVRSSINLKRIEDPEGELRLCYLSRGDVEIPEMTVHFRGADVKWKHENIFIRTSDVAVCMAALPSKDIAIYGNVAQINFLVGYDLVRKTVSFEPTDCGRP